MTAPFTIKGRIRANASMAEMSWFGVGGTADWLAKPSDVEDVSALLRQWPENEPMMVMGVASNMLVRDGGVRGLTIRLGRGFTGCECEPLDNNMLRMRFGAGVLGVHAAEFSAKHGVAELAFMSGIPGCMGGMVAMNAGAYGGEVKGRLHEVELVLRDGTVATVSAEQLAMEYRCGNVPAGAVVVAASFDCAVGEVAAAQAEIARIKHNREESQPIRSKTGGSTFANPVGHKAWQLVDDAGCRGLRRGGAVVSEKHCNFLINDGTATAYDLEMLGEDVRKAVKAHAGIELHWEIRRVGEFA